MELKETILEGTIKVFNQKGLKFTMDDIAGELGMSKKTIYTIFRDKESLFLATVDYLFDSVKESEKQVLNDLFASLGSSDIETEKEKIENTIRRLKICESAAAENSRKYGRLCKICGVSAGLMIFTLLI